MEDAQSGSKASEETKANRPTLRKKSMKKKKMTDDEIMDSLSEWQIRQLSNLEFYCDIKL